MDSFDYEYKYFKGDLPPSVLSRKTLLSQVSDINPVVLVRIPINTPKLPIPKNEPKTQDTVLSQKSYLILVKY